MKTMSKINTIGANAYNADIFACVKKNKAGEFIPRASIVYANGTRTWRSPTILSNWKAKDKEHAELLALYWALTQFTRSANLQLHGFGEIGAHLHDKEHATNATGWEAVLNILKNGRGALRFDVFSADGTPYVCDARGNTAGWFCANKEGYANALKNAVVAKTGIKVESRADGAPIVKAASPARTTRAKAAPAAKATTRRAANAKAAPDAAATDTAADFAADFDVDMINIIDNGNDAA